VLPTSRRQSEASSAGKMPAARYDSWEPPLDDFNAALERFVRIGENLKK